MNTKAIVEGDGGNEDLREQVALLSQRLAAVEAMMAKAMALGFGGGVQAPPPLPPMTTKQHATLQMLLRGASNREIAERFGVTTNTAKVFVRALFPKFGTNTRAGIVMRAAPSFERIDNADYMRASGGLPKDWDALFRGVEHDEFAHLYRHEVP